MYKVNEIFLSLQGEGVRAGTANVFVRFSGCNLSCAKEEGPRSPGGFDCDTEFVSGISMSVDDILGEAGRLWGDATNGRRSVPWIIFTGGEPALQLDVDLLQAVRAAGFKISVETNGSVLLPMDPEPVPPHVCDSRDRSCFSLFDWITVSPKVAEHAVRQLVADEVKYVRARGQGIPRPAVSAQHLLLSPAFGPRGVEPEDMAHCIQLVKENPAWRLSCQQHKWWGVR